MTIAFPAPGALSVIELMLWSAALGAAVLTVVLAMVDALVNRTPSDSGWQTFAYLTVCWLAFAALTGLPAAAWPEAAAYQHLGQVLLGPFCAAIGCFGVSSWLQASKRDRLTRVALVTMTTLATVAGPLCLLLEPGTRVLGAATITMVSMAVVFFLAVRAGQRGNALAWGMASASAATLVGQAGLYSMAYMTASHRPALAIQVVTAVFSVAAMLGTGAVLWTRSNQQRRLTGPSILLRDPVTGLMSSVEMLKKIIASQRNRRQVGGTGALMAVLIFEPEKLQALVGHSGLNTIYAELARRLQRQTGVVNAAGRYYDRCFLVLFEQVHSPKSLRTLGLRVASSLRQPIEVVGLSGERLALGAEIAVGLVHISDAKKSVDQLLHEVQGVAEAARDMRSCAALLDPVTRQVIAVESADLGSSWKAPGRSVRAGAKPTTRDPRSTDPDSLVVRSGVSASHTIRDSQGEPVSRLPASNTVPI